MHIRAVREGLPRRLLDFLIDHPDERFDGAALMQRLELQRHDEGRAGICRDRCESGRTWTRTPLERGAE
jgi:hypothetical protein